MSWDRAGRIARKLARPEVWARLGKIGTVLVVEITLAPVICTAATLVPPGPLAERLLRAQNWLRRGALWWIFPEYRAIPPEQPR